MKLSSRMSRSSHGADFFASEVVALETELESAYELVRALTSDRDVARNEARDAKAESAFRFQMNLQDIAVLHLVYEMREHALRGRIANQRRELRRLNVQMVRDAAASAQLVAYLKDRCDELEDAIKPQPAPFPAATATFAPGWRGGDRCEVLIGHAWQPARVVGFEVPHWIIVECDDGREARFYPDSADIRRPIQPSEPTSPDNECSRCFVELPPQKREPSIDSMRVCGPCFDAVADEAEANAKAALGATHVHTIDAGIASAFGAFPDLPDTCAECQEVTCEDAERSITFSSHGALADTADAIATLKRERDEATARADRAERAIAEVLTRDDLDLIEEALYDWSVDLRRQGIRTMGTRQATLDGALTCVRRALAILEGVKS